MNALASARIILLSGMTLVAVSWTTKIAAQVPQAIDEVNIPANSGAGSSGRISVNIAAGDNNQQVGDAIIAIGDIAIVTEAVSQRLSGPISGDRTTSINVADGAFAGTSGLTSINITAGAQNQMANLALLAVGNSGVMSDQLLEQSRAPIEPNGGNLDGSLSSSNDQIAIGDTAFGNGSGLIQVNLIGGEGNTSANTFALTIASEGSP